MAYEKELKVAQLAVQRAAILTKAVFHEKAKGTVSKDVSQISKNPKNIGTIYIGNVCNITHSC
jgi:3'(2'), 5'-bisphosphate nucleotidase